MKNLPSGGFFHEVKCLNLVHAATFFQGSIGLAPVQERRNIRFLPSIAGVKLERNFSLFYIETEQLRIL